MRTHLARSERLTGQCMHCMGLRPKKPVWLDNQIISSMNNGFRKFSDDEKEIVKQLIQSKENDITGLQTTRILTERLSFEGIHCNRKDGCVEIFKKEKPNPSESYRLISDICLFLEELDNSGFIIVDTIIDKNDTDGNLTKEDFWIYNHNKYTIKNGELFEGPDNLMCSALPNYEKEVFHSQKLSILLAKYAFHKVILPRSPLVELEKDNFLSREEQQLRTMKCTLKVSVFAVIISALSLCLSVIMQKCCSIKIESQDLESIVESTDSISNKITTSSLDTLSLVSESDTININE